MSYSCKILLDSISETGKRITTFEITFPRIILAEFNTHRMFSRNSASSRAIPFKKQIERVIQDPFIPERFPINGKGMQPDNYIYGNSDVYIEAKKQWLHARDSAVNEAEMLYGCLDKFTDVNHVGVNIHKQIVNRLLEPFQYHTVIVTATEFDNFFKLRCNENAQYEIRKIADLMYEAYHAWDNINLEHELICQNIVDAKRMEWQATRPQKLKVGQWHCPLVYEEDFELIMDFLNKNNTRLGYSKTEAAVIKIKKEISVARCARVSYLTHDGKKDIEADLNLYERLRTSGHWSPFEHIATPYFQPKFIHGQPQVEITHDNLGSGNFIGWKQFRKEFVDENCVNFRKEN